MAHHAGAPYGTVHDATFRALMMTGGGKPLVLDPQESNREF